MTEKETKNVEETTKEDEEKEVKSKEIAFMKDLYSDFKTTLGEVLDDAEGFIKNHKVLVIVAFIAFLLYRNKKFSIAQFVKKLEDRIKGDPDF